MSGLLNTTGAVSGVIGTTSAPAVGTAADGYVLTATGAGVDPAWEAAAAGGNTEADTWRLNVAFTGDADPISSNWERDDDDAEGLLGTGMSESSGIFSFPSTGYWYVFFSTTLNGTSQSRYCFSYMHVTENNSSYSRCAFAGTFITNIGNTFGCGSQAKILDVTDVSNIKVKFSVDVENTGTATNGSGEQNHTYATFLKLAGT